MATSVEIYGILRKDIVSGRYAPMHLFDPQQLSSEYYTSVVPIREALLRLSERGLLRRERNRGFFVERISGSNAIFYLEQLRASYQYGILRCKETQSMSGSTRDDFQSGGINGSHEYLKAQDYITNQIFSESERDFIRGVWDRIWLYRNIYLDDVNIIDYLCAGLEEFFEHFEQGSFEESAGVSVKLFNYIGGKFPSILTKMNV